MALALDEPNEGDRRLQIEGLPFIIEPTLLGSMERYLPIKVDHDPRYRHPLRVRPSPVGWGC